MKKHGDSYAAAAIGKDLKKELRKALSCNTSRWGKHS